MADLAEVPMDSLRTLTKWAYCAAVYDGAVDLDLLRNLPEPIPTLLRDLQDADAERQQAEYPLPFAAI